MRATGQRKTMPSMESYPTPRLPNWLFGVVLSALPIVIAFLGFSIDHGFLTLPRFGEPFRANAMAPVKEFAPPTRPKDVGYDGQFYAQIALDPTLRDPSLRGACDNLSYRVKRIALPCLAFVLGGGEPWFVLQIYSLLNLGFWFLLMVLLVREFGIETWASRMLLLGILWNAGCLISIGRALSDLPALCLSVAAVCILGKRTELGSINGPPIKPSWIFATVFASLSALTKETAILSLFSILSDTHRRRWWHWILLCSITMTPLALWTLYVRYQVGPDLSGFGNFAFPLYGFFNKLYITWSETIAKFPRFPLLELIAPWSVVVQIVFMLRHVAWRSPWWRFGIGFVFLAMLIGPWVWATQSAYSRCLLPLTLSFNVLLLQSVGCRSSYWRWWILGNVGFLDRAAPGILVLTLLEHTWPRYSDPNKEQSEYST